MGDGDEPVEPASASAPADAPADGGEVDATVEPEEEGVGPEGEVPPRPGVMIAPPSELCHPDVKGSKYGRLFHN
eukprot:3962841-Alexandrium_andersonii.AAC.1